MEQSRRNDAIAQITIRSSNCQHINSLRTLQRAIDLLNCFSVEENALTLTEISKLIALTKSTTSRFLATLELNGFIIKNPETLKYSLGPKLYYLGDVARKSIPLRGIIYPVMKALRDDVKEAVNLYILEDMYRVCVEQCEGLQSLRHHVKIGERLPLWAGAGGKVILAYQNEELQERILYTFVSSEEKRRKIQEDLARIKLEGCASSQNEREVGLSAVATPIFEADGSVKACISVSGSSHVFTPELVNQIKLQLKEKMNKMSLGQRSLKEVGGE